MAVFKVDSRILVENMYTIGGIRGRGGNRYRKCGVVVGSRDCSSVESLSNNKYIK